MAMQSGIFKTYDPLDKWGALNADEIAKLTPEELELYYIAKLPSMNIIFLKDDKDNDWYQWLKLLSPETLKISFNPGSKEIIHFSYDASAIFPINQIVVEVAPENVPDEFTAAGEKALGGAFLFESGKIIAAPVDYAAEAQRKKQELANQANSMIAPLQYAVDIGEATDEEVNSLRSWKKYCVLLNRIDISVAPDIEWPPVPAL